MLSVLDRTKTEQDIEKSSLKFFLSSEITFSKFSTEGMTQQERDTKYATQLSRNVTFK